MLIEFLLTSLIVVLMPGTGVLYTLGVALARGGRAGVIAAFGCTLGIVPHMIAAVFGLAALLHASALAFEGVRWAGVAWLLYLAWQALRAGGALQVSGQVDARSGWQVIATGILLNVLNPKLSIFFLAFLPQFIDPEAGSAVPRMLALSGVFMAMTFVVFVLYGQLAAAMRTRVLARPRVMTWLRRAFAGAFVALGLRLALAER